MIIRRTLSISVTTYLLRQFLIMTFWEFIEHVLMYQLSSFMQWAFFLMDSLCECDHRIFYWMCCGSYLFSSLHSHFCFIPLISDSLSQTYCCIVFGFVCVLFWLFKSDLLMCTLGLLLLLMNSVLPSRARDNWLYFPTDST